MKDQPDAVLLDTDVFSFLLRTDDARGKIYRKHVEGKTAAISFITIGELYAGAYRRWGQKKIQELEAKLRAIVIIPYDIEICKTYARLKNECKTESGTDRVIGANDLWIAACSVRHGLPLVSNNRKHFQGIPGLTLLSEAPVIKEIESQESLPLIHSTAPERPS